MALFEGDLGARQTATVKSTAGSQIFFLTGSSSSTGKTWTILATTQNYTIMNTGPNACWLGTSTSVTAATGFRLGVGEQLTVNGTVHKVAACASVAAPANVVVGLATVSTVV